jgi:hypothetical protein
MGSKLLRTLSCFVIGASLVACTRATDDLTGGGVKIQIPTSQEFFGNGNQSLAQVNYDRLCFAVHVTGAGVDSATGPVCSWKTGKAVGYLPPGGTLVIDDLPRNSELTFEIFGFLRGTTSDTCGALPDVLTQNELERTYFLGKTKKTLLSLTESVAVSLILPDETSHLGTQISLAASCPAKGVAPIAMPIPSSANYQARNSRVAAGMAASSTNFRAVGRVMGGGMDDYPSSTNFKVK